MKVNPAEIRDTWDMHDINWLLIVQQAQHEADEERMKRKK